MSRRPPHKTAHAPCPNGVFNWSDCDAAYARQWGPCKAVTGDREPVPCTRWAVSDAGWCWQHYTSEVERLKRAERIAIEKAKLSERIDAYIEWRKDHPSVWDDGTRKRKGPHRISLAECPSSPEVPHRTFGTPESRD